MGRAERRRRAREGTETEDGDLTAGLVAVIMRSTGRSRDDAEHMVNIILKYSGVRDAER